MLNCNLSDRELMYLKLFRALSFEDRIRVERLVEALADNSLPDDVTENRHFCPNLGTILQFPKRSA